MQRACDYGSECPYLAECPECDHCWFHCGCDDSDEDADFLILIPRDHNPPKSKS